MTYVNKVFLVGRLGRDAELRYTQNGSPYLSFSMATTRNVKRGDQWTGETEWHSVIYYLNKQNPDYFVERMKKGVLVFVEGRIHYRDSGALIIGQNLIVFTNGNGKTEKENVPQQRQIPFQDQTSRKITNKLNEYFDTEEVSSNGEDDSIPF